MDDKSWSAYHFALVWFITTWCKFIERNFDISSKKSKFLLTLTASIFLHPNELLFRTRFLLQEPKIPVSDLIIRANLVFVDRWDFIAHASAVIWTKHLTRGIMIANDRLTRIQICANQGIKKLEKITKSYGRACKHNTAKEIWMCYWRSAPGHPH